jgi:hypothetical protein
MEHRLSKVRILPQPLRIAPSYYDKPQDLIDRIAQPAPAHKRFK